MVGRARSLRREATEAERMLWRLLSRYRPAFTRQLVIDRYIVDLACRAAKLAIEFDGGQHHEQVAYDAERTAVLEGQGWKVIRLWNSDVMADPEGAAEHYSVGGRRVPRRYPPPAPPFQGGEKLVPRQP